MIRGRLDVAPTVGVVLGSGLGAFADRIDDATRISYSDIPGFPTASVSGHAGELVVGRLGDKQVAVMAGRVHAYEGYSPQEVVLPVRVLARLGCERLVITNAAGGIHPDFRAGDIMVIDDIINLTGGNPLVGPNEASLGPRFPDMSRVIDAAGRAAIESAAAALNIVLQHGVYCGVLGPSYETPAEIRMMRALGGDAVGMSTVPEVIAARHAGLAVVGLSVIANAAASADGPTLDHADVKATAQKSAGLLCNLVEGVVARWS